MILSSSEIIRRIAANEITVDPFDAAELNPNSVNYHLGIECIEYVPGKPPRRFEISEKGTCIQPGRLYLAQTLEIIGSSVFTPSLIGRSSMGRLGLFVQVDADLGQLGEPHCWTLELRCIKPLNIYPRMTIGQVSFWLTSFRNNDTIRKRDTGFYQQSNVPMASRMEWMIDSQRR